MRRIVRFFLWSVLALVLVALFLVNQIFPLAGWLLIGLAVAFG